MLNQPDNYGHTFVDLIGIVEEIIDESYVRVRVFGIHPLDKILVPTDKLPLALVIYPTTGGQAAGGTLSHNLEIDSWVIGKWVDYPYCQQPLVTGVVQGTDYSGSTYDSQGGEFVGEGTPEGGGGGEGVGDDEGNPGTTTNIPGGSNTQKMYNYVHAKLVAEGSSPDPHMHTAALLGVLQIESPGHRPEVVGGYKGRAWGICQWLGPRRKQLFARYGRTKRLDQQLDFMWWELNGPENDAKKRWLRATNIADATAGFNTFERADDCTNGRTNRSHPIFKRRLKEAYKFYNSINRTGAPQVTAPRPGGPV